MKMNREKRKNVQKILEFQNFLNFFQLKIPQQLRQGELTRLQLGYQFEGHFVEKNYYNRGKRDELKTTLETSEVTTNYTRNE